MWISQENGNGQGTTDHQPSQKNRTQTPYNSVGNCFPKSLRILKRSDFKKMIRSDQFQGNLVKIQYRLRTEGSRIGISVSKKYGKSHDRNRFKRIVREAFRESYGSIISHVDIHISPKNPLSYPRLGDIREELKLFFEFINGKKSQS